MADGRHIKHAMRERSLSSPLPDMYLQQSFRLSDIIDMSDFSNSAYTNTSSGPVTDYRPTCCSSVRGMDQYKHHETDSGLLLFKVIQASNLCCMYDC